MTKEETISNLKAYLNGDIAIGNIISLRSVMESAIKYLSESSLPSNLDEAAEDRVTENGRFELTLSAKMRIDDIKFGAYWMAEQGESRECTIGMATEEIHCHLSEEALERIGVSPGDKVVVQIRKKQ